MMLKFLILLILLPCLCWAGAECELAYQASEQHNQLGLRNYQTDLVNLTLQKHLPAFYRRVGQKQVPVVLINEDTYPQIADSLKNIYGQSIQLKPGLGNGHGMLLVGMRDFSHRTYWTPKMGPRENAMIGMHDSYVEVLDFANMVQKAGSTFAIFAHPMSEIEKKFIHRYLKVRRAGLFHVPSGFNSHEPIPRAFQKLCTKGEKCYDYIAGTIAHSESISAMKYHLWEYNGKRMNAEDFLAMPEIQELTTKLQHHLDQIDLERFIPSDLDLPIDQLGMQTIFHPRMLDQQQFIDQISKFLPADAHHDTKIRVLNLLVGIHALEDYTTVMHHMGLNHYNVWPDHLGGSKRLGAIYILHNKGFKPTAAEYEKVIEGFKTGTYQNTFGAPQHHLGDPANWHSPILPAHKK